MFIIGLIGGVASGKSAVADAFARRGAVVFDGDALGHQTLDEPAVRDALVKRWGPDVLDDDGHIARSEVAKIVFADDAAADGELTYLEQIVHPRIRRGMEEGVAMLPEETPAVVIDAALLLEAGWQDVCSAVVFVDAPRDQRLRRAQNRGWSADEFARREAVQMPIEEKRRRADYVLQNAGTLTDLDAAAGRLWADLGLC